MLEYLILGVIGLCAVVFLVVYYRRKKCHCDTCPSKDCPSRKKED